MKTQLSIMLVILVSFCKGQTSIIEENKLPIKTAEKCITEIVGEKIFYKYFKFDSLESGAYRPMFFGGTVDKGSALGQRQCFTTVYHVVKNLDTIGYVSLDIDENNKVVNEWREPGSSGKPELLLAYKKLLNNEFKIDYRQAIALGRQKGFVTPILNAETEYVFREINSEGYVKVKFFWTFLKIDREKPNGILNINAETGIIETEKYYQKPD